MDNLKEISISTELLQLITSDLAWQYYILPKEETSEEISFFIDEEKYDENILNELELIFGKNVQLIKIASEILQSALGRYYRKNTKQHKGQIKFNANSDTFLYNIIDEAKNIGSSDIHIETYEEQCRIRMRIDGKLVERYIIPKSDFPSIVNKVKIHANLDIAEKRLPQDGRIFFSQDKEKTDIRVSVLPTLYGEKIVLRLLNKDATTIDINKLGFETRQLENYLEGIKKPHGIILISGPTGSGKTTTLYATLKLLNQESVNISTIEDPIEYTLPGVNQTQLNEGIGLTFSSALRTFLRQDPDIIMLGEIRDSKTAKMAIRASLTGHLVLSTIHTNSAWETIARLIDMEIPAYLLAETINLTVAQRLVRVLCPHCKKEVEFTEDILPKNFRPVKPITSHYVPVGCEACYYTGYKGRKAVYEVIAIDKNLSENIKKSELNIQEILSKKKIKTLGDSAFELFKKGETSIEEIYSILISSI